jgi:hypothetical protein
MLIWQAILQNHVFCLDQVEREVVINGGELVEFGKQYEEVKKVLMR